jgi:flagellar biosynthetic protein FlhB
VVITNPAHYAVALSFSFETMEPPKMVAKGRDLLAAQIKEEARWAGIPIVENPPLARSLYRHLEPGQTIPYDLYAAVAGILAYLYRQQVEERLRRERSRNAASQNPMMNSGTVARRAAAKTAAPKTPAKEQL